MRAMERVKQHLIYNFTKSITEVLGGGGRESPVKQRAKCHVPTMCCSRLQYCTLQKMSGRKSQYHLSTA